MDLGYLDDLNVNSTRMTHVLDNTVQRWQRLETIMELFDGSVKPSAGKNVPEHAHFDCFDMKGTHGSFITRDILLEVQTFAAAK